ncbi:MAG: PhoH family protein [Clostridia bacterium]|nr:PhoH family protein [Clostridia bacterium]
MAQQLVLMDSEQLTAIVFGTCDENVKRIEERFAVRIANRHPDNSTGDALLIEGESKEQVARAARVLNYLKRMADAGGALSDQSVDYVIAMVADGAEDELDSLEDDVICITTRGKPIKPRTVGQKKYVEAIKKNTVILGVGPAGTGKTFLAVAMAVDALRAKQISRIVLTRPAVEAGEKLGFLPGDLQNKIDPYLRPLNDALFEMLGAENYARQLEKNAIEIAPLAYMRGRTLDDSFIILDEAQNTTPEQMKMFLTRLGNNSKAVVTGDPSQTDLPFGKKSGLGVAVKILKGIDGIAIHNFTERDVVRHRLVQKIILAYDKYERETAEARMSFRARKTERGDKA